MNHLYGLDGGTETKLLLPEVLGSALLKLIIVPCFKQNSKETKSNFRTGRMEGWDVFSTSSAQPW